jgi:type I restriction enzyme S subunit
MKALKLPAYPKYKDSGVEWLGEIPAHWQVSKARWLWEEIDDKSEEGEEMLLSISQYTGVTPSRSDSRSESLEGYRCCKKNDLAMNIMLAWQGGLGISDYDGIVSPAYSIFRLRSLNNSHYLGYLYRTSIYLDEFGRNSTGIVPSRWRLYPDKFGHVLTLLPPQPEQDRIVRFLDEKTGLIDELIEKKKRQIELLEEQKAIRINQAVTQGIVSKEFGSLNPHLSTPDHPVYTTHQDPLKPSGIDWIGEIPAGWEVIRFKFCASKLLQGWSPQCDNRLAEEGEWGVLKVGCVNGGIFNPKEHKSIPKNIRPDESLKIITGDFLISRANSRELVGSAAIATDSSWKLMLCDKIYRCKVDTSKLSPELAVCVFMIQSSRIQIEVGANGASDSMQNISQDIVKNLWVPCGSQTEQSSLLDFVRQLTQECKNASSKIESQLQTLQTLRSTLVANAVTGTIKL